MSNSPQTHTNKAGSSRASTSMSSSTAAFTAEMRDRQARGKNPYNSDSEDSDDAGSSGGIQRVGAAKREESFATYDRQRMAAQILNSSELLMMAAVRDDETIPVTRLKYTRMLCGLPPEGKPNPKTATTTEKQRGKRPAEQHEHERQGQGQGQGEGQGQQDDESV